MIAHSMPRLVFGSIADCALIVALEASSHIGNRRESKSQSPRSAIQSGCLLAIILWIVMPSIPFPLGAGLDSSWAIGLNLGHFDKLKFGQDIIFTYGPLGYLVTPIFPEAEPWAVFAFGWGVAFITAWALWRICERSAHWTTTCLFLGVFWVCGIFTYNQTIERLLAAVFSLALLVAIRLDAKPWFDLGLLFFFSAFALLTKFNIGVIGTGLALYFEALLLFRGSSMHWRELRPAIAALLVWPATLLGFYWTLAGTTQGVIPFVLNSTEIARGYSEAMALPGPYWVGAAAAACCALLWFAIPLLANQKHRVFLGVPPLLFIGFLCFKSSLVRQDIHALVFPFEVATAALLVVALAPTVRNHVLIGTLAIAALGLGIAACHQFWPRNMRYAWSRLTGQEAFYNFSGFLHWRRTVAAMQASTSGSLESERLPDTLLTALAGKRVAVYPWEISLIRANHLRWQPLPVFQAYSAYTPRLDHLNARELEEVSGPGAILLSWGRLDGRQPFYETPESWRALLNWYELRFVQPKIYVLYRRSVPRFDAPVPAGAPVEASWGQTIELPPFGDDEVVVMSAEVGESLRGFLKRSLLRAPIVEVQATLRSGVTTSSRRVLRSNLQDGVIVSDWPESLDDFRLVLTGGGGFEQDRVASIRFSTRSPEDFDRTIRIHWSRMQLRQPLHAPREPQ
jgi:hypothetical protein